MVESHPGIFFKFVLLAVITAALTGCKPEAKSNSIVYQRLCDNRIAELTSTMAELELGEQDDANSDTAYGTLNRKYFEIINDSTCLEVYGSEEKIDEIILSRFGRGIKERKAFQKFKEGIEILTEK